MGNFKGIQEVKQNILLGYHLIFSKISIILSKIKFDINSPPITVEQIHFIIEFHF